MPSRRDRMKKREKKVGKASSDEESSGDATADTGVTVKTTALTHRHDELMQERSKEISIRGLTLQFGDLTLVENGYLHLVPGHRYALHAENGAGKSTLMRAIVDGKIAGWPKALTTVFVEQETRGDSRTAAQILLASDTRVADLRGEIAALEAAQVDNKFSAEQGERYATLVDELAAAIEDTEAQRARADDVLRSVGFTNKTLKQASSELSGGWLMRITLALALFKTPDLLLLDEPTNHLDITGIRWLEEFLVEQCEGITILFVSHDRTFVDRVATDVVLLAGKRLTYFPGDFTAFETARADQLAQAQKKADVDAKRTAQLEAQLARARSQQAHQRDGNSGAVKAVKTKLERVGQFTNARDFDASWRTVRRELWAFGEAANVSWTANASALQDAVNLRVTFAEPEPLGVQRSLLVLDNVAFSYGAGEPVLFSGVNMSVDLASRIAIVGDNGAGKSTMMRVLAGQLAPTKGTRTAVHSARVAYFGQHATDAFELTISPLTEMKRQFPGASEQELRNQLGSMGLGGRLATMPIGTLSGGQRCRLALSALAFSKPHVMLLDEPTRHLSYTSIEALIAGLEAFKGAIVVVSHDRYFIEQLQITELWLAKNGSMKRSETW